MTRASGSTHLLKDERANRRPVLRLVGNGLPKHAWCARPQTQIEALPGGDLSQAGGCLIAHQPWEHSPADIRMLWRVATSSFDDLAESVLAQRIVAVAMKELLLMAGRKRATQSVLARIDDELLQRRLETHPRLTTRAGTMRVFRRDSAVAVLFDAVLTPSAQGDLRLAQATPEPADGIVHDLADLLALTNHSTLEGLCESVNDYADGYVWVHLANEDEWVRCDDHGRATGLKIHNSADDCIFL